MAALRSELQVAMAHMQQDMEGKVAAVPAAQEQRIREEVKVRWCGLGVGAGNHAFECLQAARVRTGRLRI